MKSKGCHPLFSNHLKFYFNILSTPIISQIFRDFGLGFDFENLGLGFDFENLGLGFDFENLGSEIGIWIGI